MKKSEIILRVLLWFMLITWPIVAALVVFICLCAYTLFNIVPIYPG